MDVDDVDVDSKWDEERLGWLAEPLEKHGAKISKGVIQDVCTKFSKCQCVQSLALNLYGKKLILEEEFHHLQLQRATGQELTAILIKASQESMGRGERLVRDLYLALLDMFAVNCNDWCHRIALRVLREAAVKHLKSVVQLPSDEIDKQSVVANLPDVTLDSPRAVQLRQQLKIPSSGTEITSLKLILEMYLATVPDSSKPEVWLVPLVQGMMLTEGVGRYVSKLLPFHKSYPIELLRELKRLKEAQLEKFALFLGFTEEEVDTLKCNDICESFPRVWRMPDLKRCHNEQILQRTLQKVYKLDTPIQRPNVHDLSRSSSSPSGLHCESLVEQERVAGYRHRYSEQKSKSSGYGSMESHYSRPSVQSFDQPTRFGTVDDDDTMSQISQPQVRPDFGNTDEENDLEQHLSSLAKSFPPCPTEFTSDKPPASCSSQQPSLLHLEKTKPSHSAMINYEVTFSSTPPESLGMGLYGEVLVVEHKAQKYAAKEYWRRFIAPEDLKKTFTENILRLRHENIVPLLGVCRISGTDRSVVVMEKYPLSLESLCEDRRSDLQPSRKLSILNQVAAGLAYLHSHDVVHGDLIPSNVLLTVPQYTAKISDYANTLVKSISTACTEGRQDCSNSCDYLPPEAFEGEITDKVDVFAFGHLSLYVVLQRKPHPLKNPIYKLNKETVARTEVERREEYIVEMKKKAVGVLKALLEWTKMCLADEANERPQLEKFKTYCCTT